MRRFLLFILAVISAGCNVINNLDGNFYPDYLSVDLEAGNDNTKTTLSGTTLSWDDDDWIGIFVNELQYNVGFSRVSGNTFRGSFIPLGEQRSSVDFIGYYPYRDNGYDVHTNIVNGELPITQRAPFDGTADYIVSNVVNSSYDEDNFPTLNFAFDNHLFSIIKITVTNSSQSFSEEILRGVSIRAAGMTLAGVFSFNVFDVFNTLSFTSDELLRSDEVSVMYQDNECPELGLNTEHTIYAVVNSVAVSDILLCVYTTAGVSTRTISLNKTLKSGHITSLESIDVATYTPVQNHKTAVYWGDSIATTTLTDYLSGLLGDNWTVVNGGVPGDTPIQIAGRMGGAPICLMDNITIPGNASESVNISGIYSTFGSDGNVAASPSIKVANSSYHYQSGNHSLINNCLINGQECVFELDSSSGQLSVHRATDGSDITVTSGTTIFTYGNTNYKDADVVICYMGANTGNWSGYEALANFYKSMIDYAGSGKFIVVGFHLSTGYKYWSQTYRDMFETEFGDRFLDLKTVGSRQGERLLIETGTYATISQISDLDRSLINDGSWPASWQVDYTSNVHPNTYGARAIALMVYEKMRSLGYLSD